MSRSVPYANGESRSIFLSTPKQLFPVFSNLQYKNLPFLYLLCVSKLDSAIGKHDFSSIEEHLQYCAKTIRPMMDELRKYADALEGEVADDYWPLPTYQEMLFVK
jgi:glutamine synthetase type III